MSFETDSKALADKIESGEVKPMNYRGTFKAGTFYRPGDMVTHAGSMFHCDRLTSSPGCATEWR